MEIPSSFEILNHKVEVIIDNEFCDKQECFGAWQASQNKIILATHYKKNKRWVPYKKSIVYHAFYHELFHCILFYLNKTKLNKDEEFVDGVGGLLAQIMLTKK